MVPEYGLPCLGVFPDITVEPARGDGSRKMAQRRCSTSPEEAKDSEDDQRDEESRQSEYRCPDHPDRGGELDGGRMKWW